LNGNAYHVVLGINIPVAAGTVLDGLTISGGNASGTGSIMANGYSVLQKNGGGMYNAGSSPVLTNVIISGNTVNDKGGGMYNDSSSPILANATISGNTVGGSDGGGMYNYHSSPVLVNVIISGNSVIWGGGGMFNGDDSNTAATLLSRPVLINVAIFGNTSSVGNGGGMYNWNAAPILTNVTISGNSANNAIHNRQTSSLQVRNSIIWGNKAGSKAIYYDSWASSSAPIPVITYSNVEGSGGSDSWDSSIKSDGGNNRDVNPSFADWQDPGSVIMPNSEGDYGLAAGSPAIDAGGNALYPDTWEKWQSLIGVTGAITTKAEYDAYIAPHLGKDLAGNARIQGTAIDMGACEKQ
jgi:hypothetical protein